ncbi:MAG: hypothetical protein AB7E05_02055 [Sphingobium sp.]
MTMPPMAGAARAADSLGVFDGWGAFRDGGQGRCYAIAEPGRSSPSGGGGHPYAAIGTWPDRGVRGQFHVRLSRQPAEKSRVYLSLGERRFALVSQGQDIWSQDAAMDGAIVSAMRSAQTMSVEGTARNGRAFYDLYVLKGAATAMDAAALACMDSGG